MCCIMFCHAARRVSGIISCIILFLFSTKDGGVAIFVLEMGNVFWRLHKRVKNHYNTSKTPWGIHEKVQGNLNNKLLKNKSYCILMLAQVISSIGDWLSIVAVITLVGLEWNAKPIEVSLIFFCLAAPMALLGPAAGVIADRFNRKSLMIFSDVVRAVFIFLLTMADTIWMVYLCLLVVGTFSTLFIPAKNGKLKEIVHDSEMKNAMAFSSMIDSSTKVAGPLLSGVLVSAFGAQFVFYIDSATFALSAFILFFLPKALLSLNGHEADQNKDRPSFKNEFKLGLSFIKSSTLIFAGMLFMGTSLLFIQFADSQLIVLIRELTAASPNTFGYLVTASGVGMVLSGLFLTKKTNYNSFSFMFYGAFGIGISFGLMAVLTHFDAGFSFIWTAVLGFFCGFSVSFVFVPYYASVQLITPAHMTGRVFGIINSVATTATVIGPLLGGWLSTIIGVIPAFVISAFFLLLLSFSGMLAKNKARKKREAASGAL